MRLMLTISIFGSYFLCCGQSIDSTAYFWFCDDPTIDSVYFRTIYHGSGELYEEGWVIQVTKDNSYKSFDPSTNFDCITSMILFVGEHKFYYKTGALSTEINYPQSLKDTVVMTIYNKRGDVVAIDKFLERPIITVDCRPKMKYGIILFDYYHFTNIKKGILRSEGYYKDRYIKTGCWKKYNRNGDIKKSILYVDDKKVEKSCE